MEPLGATGPPGVSTTACGDIMSRFWVSVFGVGLSPFAPGTCGAAVTAIVFVAVSLLGAAPWQLSVLMVLLVLYGSGVTVMCGRPVIDRYGDDASVIVSDELAGQAVTYLALGRVGNPGSVAAVAVVGFLMFRLFDIVKPPPVRQLERVSGPWGVLLDDIMAGVYANIVLQVVWRMGWLGFMSG